MEIENGYLILGHRAMPFVDPEILPNEFHLFFCGDLIQKKVVEVNTTDILPLYSFFGDEYVPQIIAQDNANYMLDLTQTDFMLPSKVNLTVFDFSEFYKKSKFKLGDRVIALVSDWDKGFVNIAPFRKITKENIGKKILKNYFLLLLSPLVLVQVLKNNLFLHISQISKDFVFLIVHLFKRFLKNQENLNLLHMV